MRFFCLLLENERAHLALAEACFRLSPCVAVGERCVFIDFGIKHEGFLARQSHLKCLALARRLGIAIRVGSAEDVSTARVRAEKNALQTSPEPEISIEYLSYYWNPFQPQADFGKFLISIKALGILTIGAFSRIPEGGLAMRWGQAVLSAYWNSKDPRRIPWVQYVPAKKFTEEEHIDWDGMLEMDSVSFVLKQLLDRLSLRLRGQGLVWSTVELAFGFKNSGPPRCWSFDFLNYNGVLTALQVMRERLAVDFAKNPLQEAISFIRIVVSKTRPSLGLQRSFFNKKEEDMQSIQSAVARLGERIGFDRVFWASVEESFWPEKSWKRHADEKVTKPVVKVSERPLRLFSDPIGVDRLSDRIEDHAGHAWKAVQWIGPERIEAEWWVQNQARDYYQVLCDGDSRLWIYLDVKSQRYFLHGVFD